MGLGATVFANLFAECLNRCLSLSIPRHKTGVMSKEKKAPEIIPEETVSAKGDHKDESTRRSISMDGMWIVECPAIPEKIR